MTMEKERIQRLKRIEGQVRGLRGWSMKNSPVERLTQIAAVGPSGWSG